MRIALALFDHATECLVRSELSTPPAEQKARRTPSIFLRSFKYRSRITLTHTDSP